MKFLRYLLFPIVPIYFAITWLRNKCYDLGWFSSKNYDFPVLNVGNLSTGGTGKSPMVSYLVSILKNDFTVATLSRGYGRKSKGFILANKHATAESLGDEPLQFYDTFLKDNVYVAVDENRQHGIQKLTNLQPKPDVIVLDDAFQHRKVSPGFSIMLSTFQKPFFNDIVLPTGNLREPRHGAKRANIVVFTKCPEQVSGSLMETYIKKTKKYSDADVFFSTINYAKEVIGAAGVLNLKELPKFTLVTGIANAKPLVAFLKQQYLEFEHLEYKDHHNFSEKDIEDISKSELIITTQKDYMRLKSYVSLSNKLYYLPISITLNNVEEFLKLIKKAVTH